MTTSRRVRLAALATTVLVSAAALLAGCSGTSGDAGSASPSATASGPTGTITVFAAASLQKTFTALGDDYESAHPGTTIEFSFAGSSDLVTQIQNGAPADVFASADQANMDKLTQDDLIDGKAAAFATNVLQIAVAPGNPKHITGLRDLADSGLQVVTCAVPVPCGAATAKVEKASGVTLHPVSEEQSVTDVLGKVESGQADAGLVYVTDVKGAGEKVDGVSFDESDQAVNTYPVGVVKSSQNLDLARSFDAYVRSAKAERVLQEAGFGKP